MNIIRILTLALLVCACVLQAQNMDSLMQAAIENNQVDKVQELLSRGADPNMRFTSDMQPTPLMYASAFNDGAILDLLLKHEVPLDEVDTNGDPAINWATFYGNVSNMKKLIKAGADLTLSSKHGNALDVAYRLWHADSVLNVFRGTQLDEDAAPKLEQLIRAIRSGENKRVEDLARSTFPDKTDGIGMPPLHHAVRDDNHEALKELLEAGADPNVTNRVGQTPLAIAARFGFMDFVETLIENGADVNKAGEKFQLTPLIAAAVGGNEGIVRKLIEKGAKIDHQDKVNTSTALHWAIFYGNDSTAKLLIDKEASYTLKCLDSTHNAYTLARAYGNDELKSYIESKRAIENPLFGSWGLNSINYIYSDTTYKVDTTQGYLLVGKSRYSIAYNPSGKPRIPFNDLSSPTEAEILAGFRSIVFNSGWYEIQGNVLKTVPDLAKVPGFEGGKQFYRYKMEGDQLSLTMFDETYPSGERPEWFGKLKVQLIFKQE